DEAAGPSQRGAVHARAIAELHQLGGGAARVAPAAAADRDPEVALAPGEPALERAEHARGDAARMPVHPHDASESLEPERMRQPAKDAVRALFEDQSFDHHRAKTRHPRREPIRHASTVQGKECATRATHTGVQYIS